MMRFIIIALFFPPLAYSQALDKTVIENIKSACVYIKVKSQMPLLENQSMSTGTGVIISPKGYVITNHHVIEAAKSYYGITFPSEINALKIITNSGSENYKEYDAKIIDYNKNLDLALLKISDSLAFPFLEIEDTADVFETQPMWVFGYPFGEAFTIMQRGPELTLTNGSITALRHNDENRLKQIQLDAVVNPGNSGGPMVNRQGRIVGIINLSGGETKLNFAIPAFYIDSVTRRVNTKMDLPETYQLKMEGLPSGTRLVIDKKYTDQHIHFLSPGIHDITAVNDRFPIYSKKIKLLSDSSITLKMQTMDSKELKTNNYNTDYSSTIPANIPDLWSDLQLKDIIFSTDFEDREEVESWQQSADGTQKNTWYIEEGNLHQFENNQALHTIVYGEGKWANCYIETKIQMEQTSPMLDPRAGIIFNETDQGFYLFRVYSNTQMAELAYHSKKPFGWFVLERTALKKPIKESPFSMAVASSENTIQCFINGKSIISLKGVFENKGKVGLYAVESNPRFDFIEVRNFTPNDNTIGKPLEGIQSYWFRDPFDENSNWWKFASSENNNNLSVLDGGFHIKNGGSFPQVLSFEKYWPNDIQFKLIFTMGQMNKNGFFSFYFRNDDLSKYELRFQKDPDEIQLIEWEGNEQKILKKKKLPSFPFYRTSTLQVNISNDVLYLNQINGEPFDFKVDKLKNRTGSFGMISKGADHIFHHMMVGSVINTP